MPNALQRSNVTSFARFPVIMTGEDPYDHIRCVILWSATHDPFIKPIPVTVPNDVRNQVQQVFYLLSGCRQGDALEAAGLPLYFHVPTPRFELGPPESESGASAVGLCGQAHTLSRDTIGCGVTTLDLSLKDLCGLVTTTRGQVLRVRTWDFPMTETWYL